MVWIGTTDDSSAAMLASTRDGRARRARTPAGSSASISRSVQRWTKRAPQAWVPFFIFSASYKWLDFVTSELPRDTSSQGDPGSQSAKRDGGSAFAERGDPHPH